MTHGISRCLAALNVLEGTWCEAGPCVVPAGEVDLDRLPGREVCRQHSSRAPSPRHIQDRIDQVTGPVLRLAVVFGRCRHQRGHQCPLGWQARRDRNELVDAGREMLARAFYYYSPESELPFWVPEVADFVSAVSTPFSAAANRTVKISFSF